MNIKKLLTGGFNNSTFKFVEGGGDVLIVNDGALGDYIHGLPFAYCIKNLGYKVTIISPWKINNDFEVTGDYRILREKLFKMVFVMNYKDRPEIIKDLYKQNVFDFNARRAKMKLLKKWKEIHWSDFYLECLSNFVKKTIFFDNGNRVVEEKYIVFHPGSSNPEKNWEIQKFISVYNSIESPDKIFVLGPSEYYLEPTLKQNGCNCLLTSDFNELESLAKKTKLFIGSDSGVAHFFATFNCKVLSIFTIGCAYTHFPYTRKGYFYFDESVFNTFYKRGIITKITLSPEQVLKQIEHILKKDNKLEPRFGNSALKCKYLI